MDRFDLFATPVRAFDVPGTEDLNRALAQLLVSESQTTPGFAVSNRGGWHSVPDSARRPDPVCRALCEMLVHHVRLATTRFAAHQGAELPRFGVSLQAWGTVLGRGGYAVAHSHAEATWSMAYYVDAGDADPAAHPDSGVLAFVDPRGALAGVPGLDLHPSTFEVRPATGKLVLFPGFLTHYVHPYAGTRPRICVAANAQLRIEPQ